MNPMIWLDLTHQNEQEYIYLRPYQGKDLLLFSEKKNPLFSSYAFFKIKESYLTLKRKKNHDYLCYEYLQDKRKSGHIYKEVYTPV